MDKFDQAVELVREERKRQMAKWGKQDHSLYVWVAILMEEVGEAAQAALHQTFGGKAKGTFGIEIIHVAAVAVQIIEWILDADDQDSHEDGRDDFHHSTRMEWEPPLQPED